MKRILQFYYVIIRHISGGIMWLLTQAETDTVYYIKKPKTSLGRKNCDIEITDDESLSRIHAYFILTNDELHLQDAKSKYGTFLNSSWEDDKNRLSHDRSFKLKDGDSVHLGKRQSGWIIHHIKYKTGFSMLDQGKKNKLVGILKELDVYIDENINETCTHLTMPIQTDVSHKLLQALTHCIPVVSPKYWVTLRDCVNNNRPLPKALDYVPKIKETTFVTPETVSLAINESRKKLFFGKTFIFISRSQVKNFEGIIKAGGGKVMSLSQNKMTATQCCAKNAIVISAKDEDTQSVNGTVITKISDALREKKRRMIIEAEIGFALMHASTERWCNPSYHVASLFEPCKSGELKITKSKVLALGTESVNTSEPRRGRPKKEILPKITECIELGSSSGSDDEVEFVFNKENLPSSTQASVIADLSSIPTKSNLTAFPHTSESSKIALPETEESVAPQIATADASKINLPETQESNAIQDEEIYISITNNQNSTKTDNVPSPPLQIENKSSNPVNSSLFNFVNSRVDTNSEKNNKIKRKHQQEENSEVKSKRRKKQISSDESDEDKVQQPTSRLTRKRKAESPKKGSLFNFNTAFAKKRKSSEDEDFDNPKITASEIVSNPVPVARPPSPLKKPLWNGSYDTTDSGVWLCKKMLSVNLDNNKEIEIKKEKESFQPTYDSTINTDDIKQEQTLEYCDKGNESFLNTTDCSIPSVSITTVTTGRPSNLKANSNQNSNERKKSRIHFNRLWSVWYGILVTLFQGYLIILGLQKYVGCSLLTWKDGLPVIELNMQLIFCGLTLLFLPLFLLSALFKVGNLANDGVKLSSRKGTCSSEPFIFEDDSNNSTMKALWMHGVPISVFIHIITALCLLLPHLLLEAKLIQNQHLPKDNIWKSEIDFILNRSDRLVILSFINTSPYQNDTISIENRYDDDLIESLDYDLNPFETHESLQSFSAPTEGFQSTLTGSSSSIQISTFGEEDEDYDMLETTTLRTTTQRRTTLPTTTTSTTQFTTTTPRTTSTTVRKTFPVKTTLPTIRTTLPTTSFAYTNSPIITERSHHSNKGQKNHNKHRKHNNRKHQKHHQPVTELDDIDEVNQEFKLEDFDSFDEELLKQMEGRNNNRRKNKNSSRSSSSSSSEQGRLTTMIERPKTTQKIFAEQARTTNGRTTSTTMKSRDSDIHIVKNTISPEFITPFTTATTNSKIIEIKSKTSEVKKKDIKRRRSVDDNRDESSYEDTDEVMLLDSALPSINEDVYIIKEEQNGNVISSAALIGAVPNFTQSIELKGIGKFLQSMFDVDEKFEPKKWFQKSPSLEFLNLALALFVWSVRYPSVFWESSKAFSFIFSLQMVANSIDILMLHVGTSILFKLQIVGQFMTIQNQQSPLLLNGIVTLALTLLAYVLIISSSMILYLYGHSRLTAKIRDCQMITLKDGDIWSYFSHCASLCFILALSVVKAPIIHDLTITYRISLDGTIFASTMTSIVHIFLWIVVWLGLTAKRRWAFKLPFIESIYQTRVEAIQPLMTQNGRQINFMGPKKSEEETIYWPSSPKLKVTFNDEVPSTLSDHNLIDHDGKRPILSTLCANAGECDEGEYATLKTTTQLQISEYDEVVNIQRMQKDNGYDDTSEEGKLLACVQDESVTYASARDLEPPQTTTSSIYSHERFIVTSEHHMISPMAPVTVQVHSEHHTSTPRFIRRADSGMPTNEALTPKSDTNSTESSTSPPERALSESSSGVHSGEENKEEVVIRPRPATGIQKTVKTPAVIQEEPYGRITNMKFSTFKDAPGSASNTLPLSRGPTMEPPSIDYSQCNTMPLMPGAHQMNRMSVNESSPKQRTTLPSNIRYSAGGAGHFLRQMPQLKNAESPYATGLQSGHHTFSSKFIQNEPLPPPPPHSTMNSSSIHQMHPFNTSTTSSPFTGMNQHSYQMVVNELCANNQSVAQFPPPPPPITHNSLQMH
ncbi:CLUMA_CG006047, isoform A [Clunio marinus]|uniref:CLUMA_CG006047, isoform A n=1 Tax=Clunio marinus TaxID=568069 RepID=A0A1J1HWW1_9DIPT|nr:CLUMA_CG006047, isoform A [Clunio marinus]